MTRWLDPRNGYAKALREVCDKSGATWAAATKSGKYIYARVDREGNGELLTALPQGLQLREQPNGVKIGRDLAGRVVIAIPPTFEGLMARPFDRMDAVDEPAVRASMVALAEVLASTPLPSDRE